MSLKVTVVIVGYRNDGDIVRCLAALEKSSYRDFQVAICENGGDQAFATLRSKIPPSLSGGQAVILIKAPGNGGYASECNCDRSQPHVSPSLQATYANPV